MFKEIDQNSSYFLGKSNVDLTIVIVIHNPTLEFKGCLEALQRQTDQKFAVIVVDNGNHKPEYLSYYRLSYIKLKKNYGPSLARNIGVHYSSTELIAFLDDDGVADVNWVKCIVESFHDDHVIALRGKIITKSPRNPFNLLVGHYDLGEKPFDALIDTEGNAAFRKKSYQKVGGFIPSLYGHEGPDLSRRLLEENQGKRIIYVPSVVLHHDYSDSLFHYVNKRFRQGKNDRFKFFVKIEKTHRVLSKRSFGQKLTIFVLQTIGLYAELVGKSMKSFSHFFNH